MEFKTFSILGLPGSGKGTQVDLLKNENIHVVTFSKLLILASSTNPEYAEIIASGKLLDITQTHFIINNYLNVPQYKRTLIFDGFPRTGEQLELLKEGSKFNFKGVIILDVPETLARTRIKERSETNLTGDRRNDDLDPNLVQKRINLYNQNIAKIIENSNPNQLFHVNGAESIEVVHRNIVNIIG